MATSETIDITLDTSQIGLSDSMTFGQEKSFVEAIVKGDPRVLKKVYERYNALFYSIARRYLDQSQEAEDTVQESFILIFKKAHTFKSEGSFEGWMKRIVVNTCLSHLKRKKIFSDTAVEDLPSGKEGTQAPWSIEHMVAEDILKAFELLPKGPRAVLNLHVLDGFSHKEIAAHLGITESASRSQLTKARARLKEILIEKQLIDS